MGKPLIAMVNMWLAEGQPQWLFRDVMTGDFLGTSYYGSLFTHKINERYEFILIISSTNTSDETYTPREPLYHITNTIK
jgi:hypothetical protein